MLIYNLHGGNSHILDQSPSNCPRCNRLISANIVGQVSHTGEGECEFLLKCPHCAKFIIAVYRYRTNSHPESSYRHSLPASPKTRAFPLLDMISDRFTSLYNQCSAAESFSLREIPGTGYRKALEFLIKDFSIALEPMKAGEIRRKFLKNVIDDHIPDGKLKTAATMTAWLGNDESHYERRWVDSDVEDLKALLDLTITFVSEEVQLEQYIRRMKPNELPRLTFIAT